MARENREEKKKGPKIVKCYTCNATKEIPEYSIGYWCQNCLDNGNYAKDMLRRRMEEKAKEQAILEKQNQENQP